MKIVYLTVYAYLVLSGFLLKTQAVSAVNELGGLEESSAAMGYTSSSKDLQPILGKLIGVVLSLVGIAFLGLMIYAGYLWMMARGNDQEVEKAKSIIKSSVVGLVIVLCAYLITKFVFDASRSSGLL